MQGKRVTPTARQTYSEFDDTTNPTSLGEEAYAVSRNENSKPKREIKVSVPAILTAISLIITLLIALFSMFYKYGTLDKSVEFVQKQLEDIRYKLNRVEDDHKKDYQRLNDRMNDFSTERRKK